MDIFFYEAFEEEQHFLKTYAKKHKIQGDYTWKTIQECGHAKPPAPIISIRTQSIIPSSWSSQVSAFLTRSTGFDHVKRYLKANQTTIPCGYLPLYCNRAVAEQALLLWLSLMRKLKQQTASFLSFQRDGLTGYECEHKTLLVVGVGKIGLEIIRLGKGVGMNCLGVDIVKKHTDVTYVSIEEGLKKADVIVCAMNLTEENEKYFNYSLFQKVKKGAIFINIARGELSPSEDLLLALEEGILSGIGLDVYNKEAELAVKLREGSSFQSKTIDATLQLQKHPQAILTPHNAFNTLEAVKKKSKQSIEQAKNFLKEGKFIWSID